jgi:cobalt-zinc-cadmium efflux system outer membrane protein
MKPTYLLLLSLLITFISSAEPNDAQPAGGAAPPRLTLEDVTDAVLAQNPAIKEALARWDATRKRVTQEAAWDDLKISGTSRVVRFVAVPRNAFTDESISVEQSIPISGKNRSRARVAVADAVAAFETVRREQLDAVTKARVAYFRLANAYAQRELNEKNLVSLQQIAEIGRSKYEVGTQSVADVLMAETEASKLLEMRGDIENAIAASQSALNVLMDRDAFAVLGTPEPVALNSTVPTSAELRATLLRRRPEIVMARAAIDAQTSNVQLAQRAWIPDPSITVQGQRYNDAAQVVSEVGAGVSFSVPWSNARKYSAGVSAARNNLAAAQHALERTENESIGRLRDALQKVETTHHHVELFRDQLLPQARQAFEASQFAYESGKAGFPEWIGAQRTLRDLEAAARNHVADYQAAFADLEGVVGADLGIFHLKKEESK